MKLCYTTRLSAALLVAAALFFNVPPVMAADAGASVVKVVKQGDGWQLLRNGQPYVVKGVGGDADKKLLVRCGGIWASRHLGVLEEDILGRYGRAYEHREGRMVHEAVCCQRRQQLEDVPGSVCFYLGQ